jgi:hypothetical protein
MAIELMRDLPVDEDPELVLRVLRKTLTSTGVSLPEVIEASFAREKTLTESIAADRAGVERFEQEIASLRQKISGTEGVLAETRRVREHFEDALESETALVPFTSEMINEMMEAPDRLTPITGLAAVVAKPPVPPPPPIPKLVEPRPPPPLPSASKRPPPPEKPDPPKSQRADAPKPDAPKADAPKDDAPKADAPKDDASKDGPPVEAVAEPSSTVLRPTTPDESEISRGWG